MYFSRKRTLSLSITGVMSALSIILLFVVPELRLIPGAPHLGIEFSNIPALAASALCGPGYGIAVVFIKSLLQLLTTRTPSFGIGESINFILGTTLVLTMWLIWRGPGKGILRYLLACIATVFATVIVGAALNAALLPLFYRLMGWALTPQVWWGMIISSVPVNLLKPALTTLPLYPVLIMLNRLMPSAERRSC